MKKLLKRLLRFLLSEKKLIGISSEYKQVIRYSLPWFKKKTVTELVVTRVYREGDI